METRRISIGELTPNTGQIEGLPSNPRQWTQTEIDRLAKSLKETPELFEMRPLLVYEQAGEYVILGGNLRFEGAKKNKEKDCPAIVIPADTPVSKLKEIVLKDNSAFGEWDIHALSADWSDLPLDDWGVKAVWDEVTLEESQSGGVEDKPKEKKVKDEKVEALLDAAMRENVKEAVEQIKHTMQKGWIASFFTKGLAQAKFIRAKYYGEHYPQWMSLYFCPQRFWTSANKCSVFEKMEQVASGETDAGLAGMRTASGDDLLLLLKGSYPYAGARMPMDFPAPRARALIEEFGGKGCRVLDPCHGWGGRLCGALLADVSLYVGVDPSPEAHAGLERAAEAFLPYCEDTEVELIQSPFETADLEGREFDMAITSPPYFDVEQYHGEQQAHLQYPQYDKWVKGFYRPLIERTYNALKRGGVFILQVGSQTYPLLKDGIAIAESIGFFVEDIRPLGGGTSSALHKNTDDDEDNEKIIVLRKLNN